MHSESEGDPYLDRPDTRLYWHPRVELALCGRVPSLWILGIAQGYANHGSDAR